MAKRHGDGEILKPLLTAHPAGGGLVRDWQRLYRDECPDRTVRHTFANAALGLTLCVTEYPEGRYEVSAAPVPPLAAAAQELRLVPRIDRNRAHNAAADEYVRVFLEMVGKDVCDDDAEIRLEELAPQAGRALANRFVFGLDITGLEGEAIWCVTPAAYWEAEKGSYNGYVPGLENILPRQACQMADDFYEMHGPDSVFGQAALFFAAGFVWRRD